MKLRDRLRVRLGIPRVTFEIEGRKGTVKPWAVRAGMLVAETRWDHAARHLHIELRRSPLMTEAGAVALGNAFLTQHPDDLGQPLTVHYRDAAGKRRAVEVRACWECGTPLDVEDIKDGRSAHEHCIYAHMDYVERWGDGT